MDGVFLSDYDVRSAISPLGFFHSIPFPSLKRVSSLLKPTTCSYDGSDRPELVVTIASESPSGSSDPVEQKEEKIPAPVASAPPTQAQAQTQAQTLALAQAQALAQVQSAREGPGTPPASAARPLRYWAQRLHLFLLSVRELQSVPERTDSSLEKALSGSSLDGKRRRHGQSPTSCCDVLPEDEGGALFPVALPPLVVGGEGDLPADGVSSLEA